jgi:serine/threonine protein kinase
MSTPTHSQPSIDRNLLVSGLQEFDHFRIMQKVGKGGMGTVYLAEDTRLGCRVALKVSHFDEGGNSKLLERFYREARLAQSVHHPFVCPVYEVGQVEGVHYLTMPFVEGTPLNRMLSPGQPWEQQRAVELVRRLALALQALHDRQVIHRDLKPHNIMVRESGEPMLMDFGLARSLDPDERRLTSVGRTLGTPAYMAPELANGEHEVVGPATDVYSLGVILYQLLTGRRPFEAPTLFGLYYQILMMSPPLPSTLRPDLDGTLEGVCLKILAKKPEDRHTGMAELAADLEAYLLKGTGSATATPAGHASRLEGPVHQPEKPRVPCPHCSRKLKLPPAAWGKQVRCPQCQGRFQVPDDLQTLSSAWDHTEARRWYRDAAEQGDADAQNYLGRIYAEGRGVVQDHAEAMRWYRKAAEQGHANAQSV